MPRGVYGDLDFAELPSLSVAAHELKSPIALMRQLSLALTDSNLSEEARAVYISSLTTATERALRLVNDLAHIGNLSPSLFPLSPINPMAVCESVSRATRPMAVVYGRTVRWPELRNAPLVSANDRLLVSVLANFIDNALKYSQSDREIAVNIKRVHERIRMSVRDFGPAISIKEYRRLVDEMDKLKSIKTRPDSSGLGIFIASQFAQAMRGEIGMIRHRDGVSFYVDLMPSRQMSWL